MTAIAWVCCGETTMFEGTQSVPVACPKAGYCEEKARLEDEFLKTIRELLVLHSQQTQAVIDGDPDFSRFDLLVHTATERKELAKYALIAHIDLHQCGTQ